VSHQPIDLWILHIGSLAPSFNTDLELLSDTEKARMDRFRSDEDKQQYAAVHAGLRRILARYLSIDPKTIQFTLNSHAKPAVVGEQNQKELHFNLSHAKGLALVAVSMIRPVGVDVEQIKPLTDHLKLAERYFSPDEVAALKSLDAAASPAAFIQLWSGKEALVKARGSGMSLPLNQFSLAAFIAGHDTQSCIVQDPGDGRSWWVSPLQLTSSYLGAVAVQGETGAVNYLIG
jgi:4'-phosphopantetheinyl transferase